jgi:hypothetical protein
VQVFGLLVVIRLKMLPASAVSERRERLKYAKFRVTHLEDVCVVHLECSSPLLLFMYQRFDRARNPGKIMASAAHRLGLIPGCSVRIIRFVRYVLIAARRKGLSLFHFIDQI